jgi:hypothetical protein
MLVSPVPLSSLSPATMMAPKLSLQFNSSFDGQESPEVLSDFDQSTSPESSPSAVSPHETRAQDWESHGRYSPRAVVASRFGELAIRGDFQLHDRSLHQANLLPFYQPNGFSTQYSDLHGAHDMNELAPSAAIQRYSPPPPSLDGHTPPTSDSVANAESHPQPAEPVRNSRQLSTSPRKNKRSTSVPASIKAARERSSNDSPSLPGDPDHGLLTWSDSEITGHIPTDPDDDGYGINGIGFKPTAAIAWSRSQKRQKQVAEWKSREAKEARERRRERRVGNDLDKLRTVQSGSIQKKVKFDV